MREGEQPEAAVEKHESEKVGRDIASEFCGAEVKKS
jgi:hypothetical protein